MKPYYEDNHIKIFNKDCRSMDELPDESVQCVVTSPPYWGLRKYSGEQDLIWGDNNCEHQWRGAYGLEPTPDCGRPFAKLKGDLTDKEVAYVMEELKRCGLL